MSSDSYVHDFAYVMPVLSFINGSSLIDSYCKMDIYGTTGAHSDDQQSVFLSFLLVSSLYDSTYTGSDWIVGNDGMFCTVFEKLDGYTDSYASWSCSKIITTALADSSKYMNFKITGSIPVNTVSTMYQYDDEVRMIGSFLLRHMDLDFIWNTTVNKGKYLNFYTSANHLENYPMGDAALQTHQPWMYALNGLESGTDA